MKEDTEALLQSVIDQKPLDTTNIFDALIKDKIADMLDVYKDNIAANAFGGGEEETEDPEEEPKDEAEVEEVSDDAELTDEEIEELIGNLSSDELEQLINDIDDAEPEEDDEHHDQDEEEA